MTVAGRFSIMLAVALAATLSIKTFVAASVLRPDNNVSAESAAYALGQQGFDVAGLTTFAGRVSVMAAKGDCLLYVIPVSEQGWHQETVRKGLQSGQSLYFLYDKQIYPNNQPRWAALSDFYLSFALAHMGLGSGYNPVFAIAAAKECDVNAINLAEFGHVPYRRAAIFAHSAGDDY